MLINNFHLYPITETLDKSQQKTVIKYIFENIPQIILVLIPFVSVSYEARAQEEGDVGLQNPSPLRGSQSPRMPLTGSGSLYEEASVYAYPTNVTFSIYQNIELGIEKIEYPVNWDIEDNERPNTITFHSLPEHSDDIAREYLRISVVDNPSSSDTAIDFINVTDPLPELEFVELPHNVILFNNSAARTVYTYLDDTFGEFKGTKSCH